MDRPRRILVVGMGRSGTTFLTEYLSLCGVHTGDVNWAHEHPAMREINDSFLERHFGARPGRRPYGRLPEGRIECGAEWHERARALVERMDAEATAAGSRSWVLKDPRTTLLETLWVPHADVVIGIFRWPAQVITSYLERRWIRGWRKRALAREYWLRFNRALLGMSDRSVEKPCFVLHYNGDMQAQCKVLCDQLQIPQTSEALVLFDRSKARYTELDPMDRRCRSLYEELLERAIST